jgi:protein subunit release factor B
MPKNRELLFTVDGKRDCKFEYFRGSGPGGQKRNKTESKVRCTHIDSGAIGESDDTRSQHENKRIAFRRMAETKEFKSWHRMQTLKHLGILHAVDVQVAEMMADHNLKVEVFADGKWKLFEEYPNSQESC